MTHSTTAICRAVALAAALGAITTAGAQSLNKEITVERTVVPERRDANRMVFTPVVTTPSLPASTLSYSLSPVTARVTPSITLLDPAAWGDSIYTSPYRGYVGVGFMPLFNGAFTAGYRPVATRSTTLDVFANYTGHVYRVDNTITIVGPHADIADKRFMRRHDASAGATLTHRPTADSKLTAAIDYTFTRLTTGESDGYDDYARQNVNNLGASARWSSRISGFDYAVGAGVRRFGFVKSFINSYEYNKLVSPNRETSVEADATFGIELGDNSEARLDAEFGMLHDANDYRHDAPEAKPESRWLVRLRPQWAMSGTSMSLRLGVNADISHGSGKGFMVAPEAKVAFTPASAFAAEVRATGGVILNPLASIFAWDPYMTEYQSFASSRMPVRVDATLTLGQTSGFWVQLFGGYAYVDNWYVEGAGSLRMCQVNKRSWHGGAALGYTFCKLASVSATADFTPASIKGGWYEWHDRAKAVVGASLSVTPGYGLSFGVDYELRSGRRSYSSEDGSDLGSVSSLRARASMAMTPQFTVFLHGTNLLNHTYRIFDDMQAQGISGLAGVTYKF